MGLIEEILAALIRGLAIVVALIVMNLFDLAEWLDPQ